MKNKVVETLADLTLTKSTFFVRVEVTSPRLDPSSTDAKMVQAIGTFITKLAKDGQALLLSDTTAQYIPIIPSSHSPSSMLKPNTISIILNGTALGKLDSSVSEQSLLIQSQSFQTSFRTTVAAILNIPIDHLSTLSIMPVRLLPPPIDDVHDMTSNIEWPSSTKLLRSETWLRWSVERFLYCWGAYLKRLDAKHDPQYQSIKNAYEQTAKALGSISPKHA